MKALFRTSALLLALATLAPTLVREQAQEAPKLVLLISIDQLRPDLLVRYREAFSGGLARFLDEGFQFTQASHAHARTSTAVGHTTLSTGVLPSRHGIVGNSWRQRSGDEWLRMYAVGDTASPIVGFAGPTVEGRSPRNLLREGLADWVQAADEDARTASLSRKDRAAIPFAGQTKENVYWILPPVASFVTSSYYDDGYPGWVRDFNRDVMPGLAADTLWLSEVPESLQRLARADSADYEVDGVHTTFPHLSFDELGREPPEQVHNMWAMDKPRVDRAVLLFAREAIEELELGQRDRLDYLGLSLSGVDLVGHEYGPYSQEELSTMIHLDRELGEFLDFLDETVGEGRWVAGFSSDHGVMPAPEGLQEDGHPDAVRINIGERTQQLSGVLQLAVAEGGTFDEQADRLAQMVKQRGLAEEAYTHRQLTRGELPDSFATLFRNSYYPGRAWGTLSRWGVEYRDAELELVTSETGTTHETVYWYDRHVPFILLGAGVTAGSSEMPVYTVDMAPTLAALAGIRAPDDLDGQMVYP